MNIILNDVTPLTLGTDITLVEDINWFVSLWRDPESEVIMDPIIKRNTNIPARATRKYSTTHDNQ